MAHTDKTDPFWVRLGMTREEYEDKYSYPDISHSFKWRNDEKAAGPKFVRWSKRYRSKRNRRRDVPHQAMRGYGYGEENYKFQ